MLFVENNGVEFCIGNWTFSAAAGLAMIIGAGHSEPVRSMTGALAFTRGQHDQEMC